MSQYFIPVILATILFAILYSIYKSKGGKYKRHKQITAAIIGAIILIFILYTCNSDNPR